MFFHPVREIFASQEAIETMVAASAIALATAEESKGGEEQKSSQNKWAKWKRGGIIGAAAVTGGALMAITGGMNPQNCCLSDIQT